jgi:hypothetical protein
MVDTRDLKSLISNDVGVRAPPWAPKTLLMEVIFLIKKTYFHKIRYYNLTLHYM